MYKDITGKVFGRVTVIGEEPRTKTTLPRDICQCSCGKVFSTLRHHLTSGTTKSCGCLRTELVNKPIVDLVGVVEGTLTVTEYLGKSKWRVLCKCGKSSIKMGHKITGSTCKCSKPVKVKSLKNSKNTKNFEGEVLDKLTVIGLSTKTVGKLRYWDCLCKCGNTTAVSGRYLSASCKKHCGCLSKEKLSPEEDLQKRSEKFLSDSFKLFGEEYDYTRVNYVSTGTKIEIGCKRCGNFWWTMPRTHTSNKGCPACAVSGFKPTEKGYLYVFKSPDVVKIGITNKEINKRLRKIRNSSGIPFELCKLFSFDDDFDVRHLETTLLRSLRSTYKSPDIKFDGYTESFVNVDVSKLLTNIEQEIARILIEGVA